jgi:hypothetical protein
VVNRASLAALWLIFAILFGVLAAFHYRYAHQSWPHFIPPERPLANSGSVRILGMDIDAPIKSFANSFNAYVDEQNAGSRYQNLASMAGYTIAFLTALLSFVLEIYPHGMPDNKDISNSNNTDYHPNLGPVPSARSHYKDDNKEANTPIEAEPNSRIDMAENESHSPPKP